MMKRSKKRYHFSKCFDANSGHQETKSDLASISVLDQPAIFETMLFKNRCIGFVDQHSVRMKESLNTLAPDHSFNHSSAMNWVTNLIQKIDIIEGVVRVSVVILSRNQSLVSAHVREYTGMPKDFYINGVSVSTAQYKTDCNTSDFHQIKSNNYLAAILSKSSLSIQTGEEFEQILLNASGYVAEGTVSNLFMVKNQVIWTPQASCGILLGVTRNMVCRQVPKMGYNLRESYLTRHELYNADEVFLTNSTCGVIPVVRYDGRVIGSGSPGVITNRLKDFILDQYQKIGK